MLLLLLFGGWSLLLSLLSLRAPRGNDSRLSPLRLMREEEEATCLSLVFLCDTPTCEVGRAREVEGGQQYYDNHKIQVASDPKMLAQETSRWSANSSLIFLILKSFYLFLFLKFKLMCNSCLQCTAFSPSQIFLFFVYFRPV